MNNYLSRVQPYFIELIAGSTGDRCGAGWPLQIQLGSKELEDCQGNNQRPTDSVRRHVLQFPTSRLRLHLLYCLRSTR